MSVMITLGETTPPELPKTFQTSRGLAVANGKIVGKTADSIRVMHDRGIAATPRC